MDFPNESGVTMVHLDDEEVRVQLSHEQQEIVYGLWHRDFLSPPLDLAFF